MREWVVYTGQTGYFLFNLSMKGIKLPKDCKYSWVEFKNLNGILYLNIGNKQDLTKIKVIFNYPKNIYISYKGTKEIGRYYTIEEAVKSLKLKK